MSSHQQIYAKTTERAESRHPSCNIAAAAPWTTVGGLRADKPHRDWQRSSKSRDTPLERLSARYRVRCAVLRTSTQGVAGFARSVVLRRNLLMKLIRIQPGSGR